MLLPFGCVYQPKHKSDKVSSIKYAKLVRQLLTHNKRATQPERERDTKGECARERENDFCTYILLAYKLTLVYSFYVATAIMRNFKYLNNTYGSWPVRFII